MPGSAPVWPLPPPAKAAGVTGIPAPEPPPDDPNSDVPPLEPALTKVLPAPDAPNNPAVPAPIVPVSVSWPLPPPAVAPDALLPPDVECPLAPDPAEIVDAPPAGDPPPHWQKMPKHDLLPDVPAVPTPVGEAAAALTSTVTGDVNSAAGRQMGGPLPPDDPPAPPDCPVPLANCIPLPPDEPPPIM